ncbi:MAG: hypothetical protein K2Q10_13155, partial [Rhodospirillales bacterium]|nr:hypothetical protein [Rhodospirillales bacterium]
MIVSQIAQRASGCDLVRPLQRLLPLLLLAAGLAAAVLVWSSQENLAEERTTARFTREALRIRTAVLARLDGHEAILRAARGLFQT